MIICGAFEDDFLRYPPAVVAEILSDSTRIKDRHTKFKTYEEQGVKYYLLADPKKETIEIFELKDNQFNSNYRIRVLDLHEKCQVEIKLDRVLAV